MNDRFGGGAGVLCKVCGDRASGKHYGVPSCDGCRGFFKRSIRRNLEYLCKEGGKCIVDVSRRNQCQACRFAKCIEANMRREAVQHERAPKMMSGVTMSHQGLNYATNIYAARHQETLFPFQMHFATPASFPLDNYYMPPPYYPHLTESLNLKLNQTVYKLPPAASSYEVEIGKMLTTKTPVDVKKIEPSDKSVKDKENEVTSSEEIPSSANGSVIIRLKSTQALYDSATKLLFLSIRWAKSIPSFNQLTINDQRKLLNDSWAELFIIAASQWGLSIDDDILAASPFLKLLQNFIRHFVSLKIDHFEAACLKALVLFRGDPNDDSVTSQQVLLLQNQTLCLLVEKCASVLRFGHLLLILPHIKMVGDAQSLQENLFKHSVGEIFIEKILEDALL